MVVAWVSGDMLFVIESSLGAQMASVVVLQVGDSPGQRHVYYTLLDLSPPGDAAVNAMVKAELNGHEAE
jgi:hypothetical protein